MRSLERFLKRSLTALLGLVLGSKTNFAPDQRDYGNILVIRQHNQLGDMLCVVPLLRALKKKYAAARISLMASPVNADVMMHNRYIDEVILYDKRAFLGQRGPRIAQLWRFIRSLRKRQFDLAIVPATVSTSFTSDLLAFLSGAPVRIGAGSINGTPNPSAFFFNVPVDLDWRATPHRHQTLRNCDIGLPLDVETSDCAIELTLQKDELDRAKEFILKKKDAKSLIIALHPGAGKLPNRWPASRFSSVANKLTAEFDAILIVTSGPMDDEPVGLMIQNLRHTYELLRNQPIRRVASILSMASLLISNDTGIMHVGASVGTRVLSLFGPTDAGQWAPLGTRNRCLAAEGGNIESISEEDVLRNAREMLLEFAQGVS